VKLILFGGAFNPPHLGHIHMAVAALTEIPDARLIFMPTFDPPHRKISVGPGFETRLQMVKISAGIATPDEFSGLFSKRDSTKLKKVLQSYKKYREKLPVRQWEVSNIEKRLYEENDRPSFTVRTIEALRQSRPDGDEIFVLIGADQAAKLDTWKEIDRLAGMVTFLIALRDGQLPDCSWPHRPLSWTGEKISSTLIREKIRKGLPLDGLVAPPLENLLRNEKIRKSYLGHS